MKIMPWGRSVAFFGDTGNNDLSDMIFQPQLIAAVETKSGHVIRIYFDGGSDFPVLVAEFSLVKGSPLLTGSSRDQQHGYRHISAPLKYYLDR